MMGWFFKSIERLLKSESKMQTSKPDPDPNFMCQVVVLVLADGRRATFTGRSQITGDDKVVDIIVTPPRHLPLGMEWDGID